MTVRIWNADTLTPIGEPLKHDASVYAVAFSPDSQQIATSSFDKTMRVWDAHTGDLLVRARAPRLSGSAAGVPARRAPHHRRKFPQQPVRSGMRRPCSRRSIRSSSAASSCRRRRTAQTALPSPPPAATAQFNSGTRKPASLSVRLSLAHRWRDQRRVQPGQPNDRDRQRRQDLADVAGAHDVAGRTVRETHPEHEPGDLEVSGCRACLPQAVPGLARERRLAFRG